MLKNNSYYSNDIELPENLKFQLLHTPKLAKKLNKERSVWILSLLFILAMNIGLYIRYNDEQQRQATLGVYQYFIPKIY